MAKDEPKTLEDCHKFYNDVKIHFEMLCTDRMRRHAYADPVAHDLAFRIFRILSGYEQALEENAQLIRSTLEAAAERVRIEKDGPQCEDPVYYEALDIAIKAILAPLNNG